MAGTPKRKHSTQRQGERRSQIKLETVKTVICPNCHKPKLPHYACKNCQKA